MTTNFVPEAPERPAPHTAAVSPAVARQPSSVALALTIAFALAGAGVIAFALLRPVEFGSVTKAHPFAMGFAKLFVLGTVGELLKRRLVAGTWGLEQILERACVWGLFGLWFALAFPAFEAAVEGLIQRGLWPARVAAAPDKLWLAFSKSVWLNGLGMYGWGMMVTHNYCDFLIHNRWRRWALASYAAQADTKFLLAFIPKTLLFWIAAQTFNYTLPPEWRVFTAALLAIVLGFLLGVGRRK